MNYEQLLIQFEEYNFFIFRSMDELDFIRYALWIFNPVTVFNAIYLTNFLTIYWTSVTWQMAWRIHLKKQRILQICNWKLFS